MSVRSEACTACRQRRLKCSGQVAPCENCRESRLECEYLSAEDESQKRESTENSLRSFLKKAQVSLVPDEPATGFLDGASSGKGSAKSFYGPEDTALGQQAASAHSESVSSIHGLYHQSLWSLALLAKVFNCHQCRPDHVRSSLERQLGLMYMGAQGLDLRFLQNNVDADSGLQISIMHGFIGILSVVHTFLNEQSSDLEDLEGGSIRSIVSILGGIIADANALVLSPSERSSSGSSEDDEFQVSAQNSKNKDAHHGHPRLIRQLKTYVQNLMDLLPTLEHCCDNAVQESIEQQPARLTRYHEIPEAIRPYVMQVQDKFAAIDSSLAVRLGEANWTRSNRLRILGEHNKNSEPGFEDEHERELMRMYLEARSSVFRPVSQFMDSGLGASLPAKSKYEPSAASHTSFLSTESAAARGAIRVPPTPTEVEQGLPFTCSICNLTLSHVRSRIDWKLHVFSDIQPYICTFGDCKDAKGVFSTRQQWANHEFEIHRSRVVWHCRHCKIDLDAKEDLSQHLVYAHENQTIPLGPEMEAIMQASRRKVIKMSEQDCPMCSKSSFSDKRSWTTHVARHLEEIALIALPRSSDSETEDGASDAQSGTTSDEDTHQVSIDVPKEVTHDSGLDSTRDEHVSPNLPLEYPTSEGFRTHIMGLNPGLGEARDNWLLTRLVEHQIYRYDLLRRAKEHSLQVRHYQGNIAPSRRLELERQENSKAGSGTTSPTLSTVQLSSKLDSHKASHEASLLAGTTVPIAPTVTSYWSVPEQQKFPELVQYWGQDFAAIASFLKTKSANMIKNHFQREVSSGKYELVSWAAIAEAKRARKEPMGPPPNPVNQPQRRYEASKFETSGARVLSDVNAWWNFALTYFPTEPAQTTHMRLEEYQESKSTLKEFKCPFLLHDATYILESPTIYSECRHGMSFEYVLTHLITAHKIPSDYCDRCMRHFHEEHLRIAHLEETDCEFRDPILTGKMKRDQSEEIQWIRMTQSIDPYFAWYDIYKILFPGQPLPLSPFVPEGRMLVRYEHGEVTATAQGKVKLKALPPGIPDPPCSEFPAEFECPLCFQTNEFSAPSAWINHVYGDIQPFSCTFPDCPQSKAFKRKADWVRHENERHRRLEWWRCDVSGCGHICYRKDNFVQHRVREHKQEESDAPDRSGSGGFWTSIEACRCEAELTAKDEPCKFCRKVCTTWEELHQHLGQHMLDIALPIIPIVAKIDLPMRETTLSQTGSQIQDSDE